MERLEARCLLATTLTGLPLSFSPSEGSSFTGQIATIVDSDPTVTPSNFKVSIDWGDGTPPDKTSGAVAPITALGSPGTAVLGVNGTHTFAEEAGSSAPPAAFTTTVTVLDTKNGNVSTTVLSPANVTDADLTPGTPITASPSLHFSGSGLNAATTLASFKSAVGGADNASNPPQASGFRTINWDGVKVDGTDFGGGSNTTVITPGHTVGIPLNRFQSRGIELGAVYAVSDDGFTDVNPSVANLFPAFSPKNTFAMFNDNGIDFHFVAPSTSNSALVNASSRGFGAIFVNVEQAKTTSISYYNGNTLLDTEFAPVGGKGQPVFVGALFTDPIVTRVTLTLGTDVLFHFDGTTTTSGSVPDNGTTHNLVVTDDWAFAEPIATPNGSPLGSGPQAITLTPPIVTATAGTPFTGTVATFSDLDPNGNAKDYTATINWGDGHLTNGQISSNGKGGFDVTGTNTYAQVGLAPINVDITDFGGAPALSVNNLARVNPLIVAQATTTSIVASPNPSLLGQPVKFTASVSTKPPSATVPTGTVFFDDGATQIGKATLDSTGHASFTTATPLTLGSHTIAAVFTGEPNFSSSFSTLTQAVINPVVANPVPTTDSLSVTTVQAGTPSLAIAVNGANFIPGSVVEGDGAIVPTQFVNGNQLIANIPARDLASPHNLSINVFNPKPGGGLSNTQVVTVTSTSQPPPPPVATHVGTTTNLVELPSAGHSVTFTASVTGSAPSTFPLDGVVTLHYGKAVQTVPLNHGVATFVVPSQLLHNVGVYSNYSGNAHYSPSTSNGLTFKSPVVSNLHTRSVPAHPRGPVRTRSFVKA